MPPAGRAPNPAPDPAFPHGMAQALVERQLRMLTRLAEMGMNIAEAAERCAMAAADAAAAPAVAEAGAAPSAVLGDPGLVYSRAARAVRLTLMLQARLLKELPALGRAETLARSAEAEARRQRAHAVVGQAIRAEHADADEAEQLSDDAWERLRGEDLGDEAWSRPVGEVVEAICRDLGLSPEWTEWAVETVSPAPGAEAPASASSAEPPPVEPGRRRALCEPGAAQPPPVARPGMRGSWCPRTEITRTNCSRF